MNRTVRVMVLVVVLVATTSTAGALAFNGEGGEGEGDNAQRVVELLGDAGVTTDTSELDALADVYGLGGAVRILAWAHLAGVDPSEIAAMRDEGMGWGLIAKELDLEVGPGIGWIMSGKGQTEGATEAQGQGRGGGHGWGPGGNPNKGGDEAGSD